MSRISDHIIDRFSKSKSFRTLFSILILLIIPFIGNRLGKAYGEFLYAGYTVKWQNLGKPPGEVNKLLACHESDLWIKTADEEIYNKEVDWQSMEKGGWTLSNEPDVNTHLYEITNQCKSRIYEGMRNPPEDTLECCHSMVWVPDGLGERNYALLCDGNVWIWQYRTYGGPAGILNIYYGLICCGTDLGLLLGVTLLIYLGKKVN